MAENDDLDVMKLCGIHQQTRETYLDQKRLLVVAEVTNRVDKVFKRPHRLFLSRLFCVQTARKRAGGPSTLCASDAQQHRKAHSALKQRHTKGADLAGGKQVAEAVAEPKTHHLIGEVHLAPQERFALLLRRHDQEKQVLILPTDRRRNRVVE